jgi:peroxiredoxin
VQLKSLLPDEQKQDTEILAVSPDSVPDLRKMVARISEEDSVPPDFPFLADLGLSVINRYGLFNPDGAGRGKYQVPHPATYVIDKEGVVRWMFVEVDYRLRPSNEDVLTALAALEH